MDCTTPRSPTALLAIVFPAILLFTSFAVNLNGGDWDGVQIALACFFPQAAQDGDIIRYAYEWQPLTYAIIRLTYVATGSPELVMFLPALFGSLGLPLLLLAMCRWSRPGMSLLILTGIMLLIPELLFTCIYMNSTVFGFPFLALALWLAAPPEDPPSARRALGKSCAIGLCLALASLCRFDYLLCYPLFLVLVWRGRKGGRWGKLLALGGVSAVVFLLGLAVGMVQFTALLERVDSHHTALAALGMHHRNTIEKLQMALIGVNLFLWAPAVAAALCWLFEVGRQQKWGAMLMIAAVAVLLFPALSLGTPKYLLAFYACLAVFLAWSAARRLAARTAGQPALFCALGAALMLACFLPCRMTRRPPFVRPTMRTWIDTDDGPRACWGYAFALRYFPTVLAPPDWLHPLVAEGQGVLLVAPYDGWVAGPLSQRFLLYMVRQCTDVTITPGTCVGASSGKRIVITDPSHKAKTLREHFGTNRNVVAQRNIPLDLGPTSEAIIKALSAGPATPEELARQVGADQEALNSGITSLRKALLLDISKSGEYHLTHLIPPLEPAPEPRPSRDP